MMLSISEDIYNKILEHCREAYPHECCGILVGKLDEKERSVLNAYRTENMNKERSVDRYEIAPDVLNRIDREARAGGLDIVGFYHSHPDHPVAASEFDRERGQAGYSYIILSINKGNVSEVKSWTFEEEDEPFVEEAIDIV